MHDASPFICLSMDIIVSGRFISWLSKVLHCGLHLSSPLPPTIWHAVMFIKSDLILWTKRCFKNLWEDMEEPVSHCVNLNISSHAVVVLSPGEQETLVSVKSPFSVIIPTG